MASTIVGKGMNLFKYFQFNKDTDTAQDTRTILLTIFTLIAAATFQAGINPPGGVWQEDHHSKGHKASKLFSGGKKTLITIMGFFESNIFALWNHILLTVFILIVAAKEIQPPPVLNRVHAEEHHFAGSAIFSSRKIPYYVFLLSNTFAFSNSILVILSLTHKFPFKFEIRAATLSMAVTYGSAIFAITPDGSFKFRFVLTVAFVPFVIRFLISIYNFWYSKSQSDKVSHISDSVEVKIPSGLTSGVRSSPVNRRSHNIETLPPVLNIGVS